MLLMDKKTNYSFGKTIRINKELTIRPLYKTVIQAITLKNIFNHVEGYCLPIGLYIIKNEKEINAVPTNNKYYNELKEYIKRKKQPYL